MAMNSHELPDLTIQLSAGQPPVFIKGKSCVKMIQLFGAGTKRVFSVPLYFVKLGSGKRSFTVYMICLGFFVHSESFES